MSGVLERDFGDIAATYGLHFSNPQHADPQRRESLENSILLVDTDGRQILRIIETINRDRFEFNWMFSVIITTIGSSSPFTTLKTAREYLLTVLVDLQNKQLIALSGLESEFGDIAKEYRLSFRNLRGDGMKTYVNLFTQSNKSCVLITRKYSSSNGKFQWKLYDMIEGNNSPIFTDLTAAKSFLFNMLNRLQSGQSLGAQATPDAWHALSRLSDMVERLAVARRY